LVLPGTTPLGVVPPRVAVPRGDPADAVDPDDPVDPVVVVDEPPARLVARGRAARPTVVADDRAPTSCSTGVTAVAPSTADGRAAADPP